VVKPQVKPGVSISSGKYVSINELNPRVVREMRRDPTIFLARLMVRAPILATTWTVECDDDNLQFIADFIDSQLMPKKDDILNASLTGLLDFGWQPFEKCFDIIDGQVHLTRLKPLLQDLTDIRAEDDGTFIGFEQNGEELPLFYSFLMNVNVECDMLKGESYMANAYPAYEGAKRVTAVSETYDKKIAGAHWVITFPDGNSMLDGVEVSNDIVAKKLIDALEASGSFAIPRKTLDQLEELNGQSSQAWDIKLLEASGSGDNFDTRLARFDKEKVRSFGLPERSVLEGQFGTKAEAVAHGDFALTAIEQLGASIVSQINRDVVSQLIRLNFGPFKGVYLKQQPLNDIDKVILKDIYMALLSTSDGQLNELSQIDFDSIRDRLGIPYVSE
jgi:hypothetical protein